MKALNILHLSSEKHWRGGEQQIAYLIEELSLMNVNNFVAAKKKSVFLEFAKKENIPSHSVSFSNSLDVFSAIKIFYLCKKYKIDLIHLHSSKSHSIAILSYRLGNKVPLVLSRKVNFPLKKSFFTEKKYNFEGIKRIICVSNSIKKLVQNYIAKPEKCLTIYDGIDLNKINPTSKSNKLRTEYNLNSNTIIIGNTSALENEKDYFSFINAIELVSKKIPYIHGFIIGKGSQDTILKEYISSKKLNKHITFTGFRDDIAEIVPEFDIFLMTSKNEGLGTSILDAFLAKVPVIATNVGGIPEIVEDGVTGLLVPVSNHYEMVNSIEKLFNNPELVSKLTENAAEKVLQFSKKNLAIKTLEVYREVLEETQPIN